MHQQFSSFTWGRAAAAALLAFALPALVPHAARTQDPAQAQQQPQASVVVDTVLVRGNQRLSEAQVRSASGAHAGTTLTAPQVQAVIRRLMDTGNFEQVSVLFRETSPGRGALVIQVAERPLVGAIEFRGLESVSARTVRDSAGLEENAPLNPQAVADAMQLIRDMLAGRGIQLMSVDTSLVAIEPPSRAYRLVFDVREGNRLAIADVNFRGNRAFDDAALTGAIRTKPEGFFWYRSGRFDREAFQTDLRENLPEFYGSHGYIDFRVLSDTLEVDPQTGKARLVVEVDEGPQYRLGEFTVQGNSRFPSEELERYFTAQRRSVLGLSIGGEEERQAGEVFDRAALDAAAAEIEKLYRNEGYLFANVRPFVEKSPLEPGREPTVNVVLAVSEQSPFYINRISFAGNSNTHENVLRDRLWILPGDVYNEERLVQSWQALGGLGFFEVPMEAPDIVPNPEAGTVDITFRVKEKQTGNIGFGTVFGGGYGGRGGGFSGFLSYTEPNLFGQAKQANLRAEYGTGRSTLEASYTDPAIFGTRNSGSVSVFRTGDRFIRTRNGRRIRTGGSLQFGFPVPSMLRTRAFLGYSLAETKYQAIDDSCEESQSVFCLPDATASTLSFSIARDTKNHPIFPTQGTRQTVGLEQTGGPLGGDGNFQKLTGDAEWWVPIGRLGSGQRPIRFALGLHARAGSVFGDVSRFPFERFFIGGVLAGQPLRGYTEYSIGPRGYNPRCQSLTLDCLGDSYVTVTGEYAVRISDILSVSAFADAGNVFGDVTEFDPTRLFRGAGIGATLVTPFLGAIGIDAAYGFDRPDPQWEIHVKLGQGF